MNPLHIPAHRPAPLDRRLAVAPMMDWTDRHCRYLLRLISPHALLYTEMVTTGALLHGDRARLLAYNDPEHPVALQLGGSAPAELARCARYGHDHGYDEINLNCGCPSDRVQDGCFGARLFAEPERVAEGIAAMKSAVPIPVTVKTRLGIDDLDCYEHLYRFIETVARGGCEVFILHARKAWLSGLSPKENREVPPLDYERVYRIKADFPHLTMVLNGGVATPADARRHLQGVDGVMIGREAYHNPYGLAAMEREIFGNAAALTREEVVRHYQRYVSEQNLRGVATRHLTRPLLGLFQGEPGARLWRRCLSEHASVTNGAGLIEQALTEVLHRRSAEASDPGARSALAAG